MATAANTKGEHLFLVLHKAGKAVSLYDQGSIASLGFNTLSDFAVLEHLRSKGPQPVNTIARSMMLTSGSMTTAVDRAVSKGLVKRKKSSDDARVTLVSLTPKGKQLIDVAFDKHAARLETLFAVLDKEEKREFLRLVKKVGKAAEALNL